MGFMVSSVAVMIPAYSQNRGYSIFFISFSVIGELRGGAPGRAGGPGS